MKPKLFLVAVLFYLTACASKQVPSTGPPSGTWSGDYGPDAERREQIRLDLKWEDSNLRGVVRAGFRDLPVSKISFKPESGDRKSTRLNSSHSQISYAVFCLKKKKKNISTTPYT